MRYSILFLSVFGVLLSCSPDKPARTNFAEITVNGQRFVFDSLEALYDSSYQQFTGKFRLNERSSNSEMKLETWSFTKWINGVYEYPGRQYLAKEVTYFSLQTYLNRVPGSYSLIENTFKLTIDQSENGRLHGTFSGKLICYTCVPYGDTVELENGEFEMPYRYN